MLKPLIGITVILTVSAAIALAGSQGSVMIGPYPLFALCTKVNAVCRGCYAGMLKTGPFEAMEIHNYLMMGFINMNIG